MRQYLSLVLGFLLVCPSVHAAQKAVADDGTIVILNDDGTWKADKNIKTTKSDSDFRKTRWGMSKTHVKRTESGEPKRDDGEVLAYVGNVVGMDALIVYIFAENKLVRGKYVFVEEHSNKNDYLSDYKSIKDALTKKYGKPKKDETMWRNDLYKDDYSHWGFAVSLGHLMYFAQWETDGTDIALILSGENYHIKLVTEYSSKALEKLEEKAREKKRAGDL